MRLALGADIRTTQKLLGRKDVRTKTSHINVLNRGGGSAENPLDRLEKRVCTKIKLNRFPWLLPKITRRLRTLAIPK
jgi:hypothetical protein